MAACGWCQEVGNKDDLDDSDSGSNKGCSAGIWDVEVAIKLCKKIEKLEKKKFKYIPGGNSVLLECPLVGWYRNFLFSDFPF